eukprot:g57529.t1
MEEEKNQKKRRVIKSRTLQNVRAERTRGFRGKKRKMYIKSSSQLTGYCGYLVILKQQSMHGVRVFRHVCCLVVFSRFNKNVGILCCVRDFSLGIRHFFLDTTYVFFYTLNMAKTQNRDFYNVIQDFISAQEIFCKLIDFIRTFILATKILSWTSRLLSCTTSYISVI